jgi:hypothetical protein
LIELQYLRVLAIREASSRNHSTGGDGSSLHPINSSKHAPAPKALKLMPLPLRRKMPALGCVKNARFMTRQPLANRINPAPWETETLLGLAPKNDSIVLVMSG